MALSRSEHRDTGAGGSSREARPYPDQRSRATFSTKSPLSDRVSIWSGAAHATFNVGLCCLSAGDVAICVGVPGTVPVGPFTMSGGTFLAAGPRLLTGVLEHKLLAKLLYQFCQFRTVFYLVASQAKSHAFVNAFNRSA
jgi:hypothetical protein